MTFVSDIDFGIKEFFPNAAADEKVVNRRERPENVRIA